MSAVVTRRSVFASAAAALAAAGCGSSRRARAAAQTRAEEPSGSSVATGGAAPFDLVVAGLPSSVLAAFNEAQRAVKALPFPAPAPTPPPLIVNPVQEGGWGPHGMEPITSALHTLNFDPSQLLLGSVKVFTAGGQIYAVPTRLAPWCVCWRTDVFEAAGLPPPVPTWTIDDFEGTCAALQRVVTGGKVPLLQAVLGPMVGSYQLTDTTNNTIDFWGGAMTFPGLWEGFALGFGGSLIDRGSFTLTDSATVAGLGRLVGLARDYALAPSGVAAKIHGLAGLTGLFAMDFTTYPRAGVDARWRYTRLPAFPIEPVVPVVFEGAGLYAPRDQVPSNPSAVAPYQSAAAGLLAWTYSPGAQALLRGAGFAPVLADPAVQRSFWSAAAAAVGDWQHFVSYASGWPTYPPEQAVTAALAAAVQAPESLAAGLAKAEATWNAAAFAVLSGSAAAAG